jgi:hypothetical protein
LMNIPGCTTDRSSEYLCNVSTGTMRTDSAALSRANDFATDSRSYGAARLWSCGSWRG